MMTRDEFSFGMHTDFEQMWLPRDEAAETRERHITSGEKLMVTSAWNSDGFRVTAALPKGQKFKANSYCSSMLTKLSKIARQLKNETERTLILHADNACLHTAKSSIEFCA
jgi:hypothetical protein